MVVFLILLSMVRKLLVVGVMLATLTPSAFAAGSVHYGTDVFAVPDSMTPQVLTQDCSDGKATSDDMNMCATLKLRRYTSPGWQIVLFKGNSLPPKDSTGYWSSVTLNNFKALMEGTKTPGDFYDANGKLKDENSPVFELVAGFGGSYFMAKDIEPISIGGQVYGYAFTPSSGGGNFPPSFEYRVALFYLKDKDLVIGFAKDLNISTTADEYLETSGKRNADGSLNMEYYSSSDENLVAFLGEYYNKFVAADSKKIGQEVTKAATSFFMDKSTKLFLDVDQFNLLEDSIGYVKAKGYVQGYADGTFKPDAAINRAEFTKILVEARGGDQVESYATKSCFPDVPASLWFTKYVCYAKDQKIINGYPDGTFGPEKNINMAEALKIVLNSYEIDTPKEGANWYDKYWKSATENGFLARISSSPAIFVKRGELAELITRVENGASFIFYGE